MAFVAPFEYISIVGSFGLAGMAGAALMWLLLSLALFHQRIGAAIMTLLFGAGVAWNWIVPDRYVDSTCHNVILQGETSISARESLEFEVAMQDWRELEAIAKDFADDHGLSFRSDVRPSYDFPWFQLSMCNSDGTVIDINRIGIENGLMSLAVYQSNDDVNWRPLTREFAVGVNSSGILQQQLKPESLE
ncbi:hypothetical protein [Altererythrobacter sp. GH1-8]|uniref:hypothetical protein n=1 Tax=Altererythrobacter sp. GH1-8 TaxID=3349333 RepID=UPI00374D3858